MGSFCEGVLSFSFRKDTPDYVLAGFSALAGPVSPEAPSLPPPVEPDPYGLMPTDFLQGTDEDEWFSEDPFPGEPWRQDWSVLGDSMGVMFVGHAQLFWSGMKRWTLSARFSLKDDPERILRAIEWLGPYIEPRNPDDPHVPLLLGYLRHEYQVRPILVWHRDQMLYGEDLRDEYDVG
jgi:hypothetical protein